jgi:DNA end-binding protein Ku
VPADDLAEEAYIVLREALKRSRKVGVGQISVRGQEHLVALKPCGRGMVLEMLRYADEVQKAHGFFAEIGNEKPQPELLELATTLIDKKAANFEPGKFHDRYQEALKRLIEKKSKAKGKKVLEDVAAPEARGSNVIDLMAALKSSLGSGSAGNEDKPAKRPSAKKPRAAAAEKARAKPAPKRKRA